ncbi:glutamine synthetase family protein [Streptomyces sp. GbtcB6]|uniref:glutamine synthetase family protein n=1 Tax=Streptomyces sp. GbtcB6 TaxID=2824751 RepID=UPI001C30C04E|nr:glutamine synthetase family protein [Streptomyces sp. GbtcB6]
MGFIERHGLWSPEQRDAAAACQAAVERDSVETVRLSFVDQHGVLRGKSISPEALPAALRDGLNVVSTLLSKDTSGRTVFPSFSAGGGHGVSAMSGAGDMIMVPDPATYRVLPWADGTAWVLCDLYFGTGEPVPFSTRGLMRRALDKATVHGFEVMTGIELEFHLFRLDDARMELSDAGQPGNPKGVSLLGHGYQLLSEDRDDAMEPVLGVLRRGLRQVGLPLRTLEVEYGPSQFEVTFGPQFGLAAADSAVLLRSVLKQIARRHGYHVSFMCRPQIPLACSSGWHLHQSLHRSVDGILRNAFVPDDPAAALSPVGMSYVAGQLKHAAAASAFAVPTITGYKRFQPQSMAPDRILWARDNRAAMIRVVGSREDGSTHIENRLGEPAANPYLYLGTQLLAGLDGIERSLAAGPSADEPYVTEAPRLPRSLGEALDALRDDKHFADLLGAGFVEYYSMIKRAELARFELNVTDWEQREYFDLL